jgi:polar amino acid transport system substrate-binding protein
MRRLLIVPLLAALAFASACGSSTSNSATDGGSAASASAATCTPDQLQTLKSGTLTIGTSNPAFSPYFTGGPGHEWKGQFNNDPYTGKGFEAAVAYAVADKLGYSTDQVTWQVTPFGKSFAPGPKDFDFYLAQVTDKPPRDQRVDFSIPYYQANQAVVVKKDSQYAHATSLADLQGATLGAEVSTTSYEAIQDVIQPSSEAKVYNSTSQATQALENGQIDGLVVDFPTAYYIAYVEPGGLAIAGQFAGSGGEDQWGLVMEKGSSLKPCVDRALNEMKSSGELAELEQKWLSDLADAPTLQ